MVARHLLGFTSLFFSLIPAVAAQDTWSAARLSTAVQVASVIGPSTANIADLERTARDGNASEQFRLGMHYLHGDGVAPDVTTAMNWFRMAAEGGHARAAFQLGVMYRDGSGVARDNELAEKWLRFAAASGHSDARRALQAMQNAQFMSEFEQVRARAVRGDAQAQLQVGKTYLRGEGAVPADPSEALNWLRKAGEQHNAEAQHELGLIYQNGIGVERNPDTARAWFEKAAGQGLLRARVALQDLARERDGATLDPEKAFRATTSVPFYESAIAGDANAQYELGLIYINGDAVARDYRQGLYWLRKAAEQDNVDAQLLLADLYVRGTEIEGDYSEAVTWYTRAARLENAEAQYMLANLYRMGLGVKPDADAARQWYAAAAKQGHPKAKQRLADASR